MEAIALSAAAGSRRGQTVSLQAFLFQSPTFIHIDFFVHVPKPIFTISIQALGRISEKQHKPMTIEAVPYVCGYKNLSLFWTIEKSLSVCLSVSKEVD